MRFRSERVFGYQHSGIIEAFFVAEEGANRSKRFEIELRGPQREAAAMEIEDDDIWWKVVPVSALDPYPSSSILILWQRISEMLSKFSKRREDEVGSEFTSFPSIHRHSGQAGCLNSPLLSRRNV